MAAYYNEIDPYCAQWLRNLIAQGLIAPGDVDERDIRDVRPVDLRGKTVALASWPTTRASDADKGVRSIEGAAKKHARRGNGVDLPTMAVPAWATPAARDYKSESATDAFNEKRWSHSRGKPLSAEATLGISVTGSPAQTEKRGQLNPEFSLWLMGYPPEWASCAPPAMPSSRKSRRSS